MSSLTLNLDQHTLCVNDRSELITKDGDIMIFDKLTQTTLTAPYNPDLLNFLLQVPATIINSAVEVSEAECQPDDESQGTKSASLASSSSNPEGLQLNPEDAEVWIKNAKPCARDREASDAPIKMVGCDRFQSLLKDKTSKKKNVWAEIGKEMMKFGFLFGTRDPETVCFQKWRNMESKTISFLQNAGPKCTGAGKIQKPVFFDEVRDVIKDSAKASPVNLLDSCVQESTLNVR